MFKNMVTSLLRHERIQTTAPKAKELKRIADMAALAAKNGIEPHAGHGLTYENVQESLATETV